MALAVQRTGAAASAIVPVRRLVDVVAILLPRTMTSTIAVAPLADTAPVVARSTVAAPLLVNTTSHVDIVVNHLVVVLPSTMATALLDAMRTPTRLVVHPLVATMILMPMVMVVPMMLALHPLVVDLAALLVARVSRRATRLGAISGGGIDL